MNTAARFIGAGVRGLNPVEKLEESVDLWLDQQLDSNDYRAALAQVSDTVERAQSMLADVQFPSSYDAGPTLLAFAHNGLDCMAEAVANLRDMEAEAVSAAPDRDWAEQNLCQAREAYEALGQLLREVQVERCGG